MILSFVYTTEHIILNNPLTLCSTINNKIHILIVISWQVQMKVRNETKVYCCLSKFVNSNGWLSPFFTSRNCRTAPLSFMLWNVKSTVTHHCPQFLYGAIFDSSPPILLSVLLYGRPKIQLRHNNYWIYMFEHSCFITDNMHSCSIVLHIKIYSFKPYVK